MSATSASASSNPLSDTDDLFSDDSSVTKVAIDAPDADLGPVKQTLQALQAQRDAPNDSGDERDHAGQVFWWLLAFRILNASVIRTLFLPDEYFQALEPAWDIAFGADSGAWVTWEWRHQMRSTIPPFVFGSLYWLCDKFAAYFALSATSRADMLIAAPKMVQACIAAVGDYYIWKLGELAYGYGELAHWFALIITVANPFHFFVITRTLSNCLELSLNAAALYLWFTSAPEEATLTTEEVEEEEAADAEDSNTSASWISTKLEQSTIKVKNFVAKHVRAYDLNRLRLCLALAAVACVLRITNVLTWLALVSFEFLDYQTTWSSLATVRDFQLWLPRIRPALRELNHAHGVLVREAVLCGSAVLAISAVLDKQYYGCWTFPAFQFLYVNVVEGVSMFYGTHDVIFYFTQGFPLLLGAFLPFAAIQIHHYLLRAPPVDDDFPSIIKYEFSSIAIFVPLIFSFIAHKETRFIYPLIPILHVLAAGPAAEYFRPIFNKHPFARHDRKTTTRFAFAAAILVINVLAAIIISIFHQRGPIDVLDYIRHEHEAHYLSQPPPTTGIPTADTSMTVGFLMPCHSTPWRSHLVHPSIKAWALGCEPPLGLSTAEKAVYRDEADQFYDAPEAFLTRTLGRPKRAKSAKSTGGIWSWGVAQENDGFGVHGKEKEVAWDGRPGAKIWPEYLVFFAEKEELLSSVLEGTDYVQCWRGWNTWWHDDWRRKGDIVVWCHREKPVTLQVRDLEGVMAQKLTRKVAAGHGKENVES